MPRQNNIQFRKGTQASWTTNQTQVLASGEPGFETDTLRLKIGNGTTAWSELNYVGLAGTGTSGYLPKFNSSQGVTNSLIFDNGTGVAIGTTTPNASLTVYSTIYGAPNSSNRGAFNIAFGNTNGLSLGTYAVPPYSNYIQSMGTAGAPTYPLVLNPIGGNVGIGTTSPSYLLDVAGDAEFGSNNWLKLIDTGGNNGRLAFSAAGSIDAGGTFMFRNNAGSTEHMRITTGGNVGIRTTSPESSLTINTTIGSNTNINSTAGYAFGIHHSGMRITSPEDTSTNPNYPLINLLVSRPGGFQGGTASIDFDSRDRGNAINRGIMARILGGNMYNTAANASGGGYLSLEVAPTGSTTPISRIAIINTGNVGIGLTDPDEKLEVDGNIHLAANGKLYFGTIGTNTVLSDDGGSNRTVLLARNNTFDIINAAGNAFSATLRTGFISGGSAAGNNLVLKSTSGAGTTDYISLAVGNNGGTEALRVINNGNVGIGTSSPSTKLHVNGASATAITIETPWAANAYGQLRFDTSIGKSSIRSHVPGNSTNGLQFFTYYETETVKMTITGAGDVGIGTTTPSTKLHTKGTIRSEASSNTNYLQFYHSSSEGVIETNAGSFSFSPANGIAYLFKSGQQGIFRVYGSSGGSNYTTLTHDNSKGSISTNIGDLVLSPTTGKVGINTSSSLSYNLQVNGSFGATTKSFLIDHPSRPNYSLEYGSLESPYHGVRLTGRGTVIKGSGTVLLPYYLKDLIHDDENINIQITNIKHGKTIYVDEIDLNNDRFTVRVDRAKSLGDLEFFWVFTGVRKDVDNLVVEREK